jgi:hypothetical protein
MRLHSSLLWPVLPPDQIKKRGGGGQPSGRFAAGGLEWRIVPKGFLNSGGSHFRPLTAAGIQYFTQSRFNLAHCRPIPPSMTPARLYQRLKGRAEVFLDNTILEMHRGTYRGTLPYGLLEKLNSVLVLVCSWCSVWFCLDTHDLPH